MRVEGAERLVEEQHAGLDGQRAGQRHALALATRQLRREAVGELLEVHQLEQLRHAGADLVLGPLADLEPERHVAEHAQVLEGGVVLEHEADVALLRGQAVASTPSISTVPESGSSSPAMMRSSVDLPPPLGPSRAVSWPVGIDSDDVVEGDEVAEALGDVADVDAHQAAFLRVGGRR